MLTSPMYIQTQYNGTLANGCLVTGRVSLLEDLIIRLMSMMFALHWQAFDQIHIRHRQR
ncbi:MAG: hypothetical protein O2890_03425 [Cyanobacteria bacterium]|nr:hypothetical protein [Cyanobacteriota bacterium]MDA0865464.1 hypothetical protein [Cyanobacteriota bacterium]